MPAMRPEMYGLGQAMMRRKGLNPYQGSMGGPQRATMPPQSPLPGVMGSLGGKPYMQDTGMSQPAGPAPQPGRRNPMIADFLMNRLGGQSPW